VKQTSFKDVQSHPSIPKVGASRTVGLRNSPISNQTLIKSVVIIQC